MQNPRDVANEAIRCIKEGSLDKLVPIFSAVNRERLGALNDKIRQRMAKFMEKSKRQIGDVTKVGELRDGSARLGPGGVYAFIRKEGDEVFVVSLKKEGKDYTFDDINSPAAADYDKLSILKL
jgi:hypothetical protein